MDTRELTRLFGERDADGSDSFRSCNNYMCEKFRRKPLSILNTNGKFESIRFKC